MSVILLRSPNGPRGTFGILFGVTNEPFCLTLELPWRDNEPKKSCIPLGDYQVIRNTSPKGGFRLKEVPGRSDILIHAGNTIADIEGCILVGKELGYLNDKPAVLQSKAALKELVEYLPAAFDLRIVAAA